MLSAESSTRARTPSGRISYARIDKKVDGISYEKFEIPNLIELQLDSFAWFVEKGLARAVRRDQPDQGLHRQGHGAPVPRLRVRRAQVLRGGVPDQGPDVQQAAVRQRRAPDQGDRRDPAPARLHGRLPVDDRPGHVRHQRRRARRRQPARPLAGRLLQRDRGSRRRAGCCSAPRSSRTAAPGSSSRPTTRTSCGSRSIASARSRRRPCSARSATSRTTRSRRCSPRRRRPRAPVHRGDPRQGPHPHPGRGPHRGLQEAAPGRSAHRRQRPPAGREPVLQLPPLRPRSGRPLQVQQEARPGRRAPRRRAAARAAGRSPARTSPRSSATSSSATAGSIPRTTSTTSATAASGPTAS